MCCVGPRWLTQEASGVMAAVMLRQPGGDEGGFGLGIGVEGAMREMSKLVDEEESNFVN